MSEPTDPPQVNPEETPAWRSYLVPRTTVLRNLGKLTDPAAVATSSVWSPPRPRPTCPRTSTDPRPLTSPHLNGLHEQLFAHDYPFAEQLRIVDTAKTFQTGEPFLHHR